MPPLVLGTLQIVWLMLLSAALGRRLLGLLRVRIPDRAEYGLFATALGLGALQFVPFLLFALDFGHPATLRWTTAILALLLIPDMAAVVRAGWRWAQTVRLALWWQRVLLCLLTVALLALYARALCPPFNGDAVSYHLSISVRFLQNGRFIYLPTLTPTNWPSGMEMLTALLLALHPQAPVAIVQFLMGVLTLIALYLFARRFAGAFAGWGAIGLFLLLDGSSAGGFWQQMTLAIVDVGLTLFTTLAIMALHRATLAETGQEEAQWNRLSAVCAGLAATTKLTGVWVIVSLVLLRALLDRRAGRAHFLPRALAYGAIATAIVLPWFLKTWVLTGNPLYPMGYALFGGREWTPTGWANYKRAHLILNTPPGMQPTPFILTLAHTVLAAVGLAFCIWILRATRGSRFAVPAGAAGLFLACICVGNYFHPRFLMPIFPAALACWASVFRGRERMLAPVLCGGVALMTVGFLVGKPEPPLATALRVALGRTTREDFLRAQMPDYAVTEYANAHIPPTSRILVGTYEYNLVYYNALAMWPDCWLQDSLHYGSLERLKEDFRRLGITHLVLKTTFPPDCAQSHYCRRRMQLEPTTLSKLARRYGTRLFAANDHTLYALDFNRVQSARR